MFSESENNKQPLHAESLFATNHILGIEIQYLVEQYAHVHQEAW
jgi:hypothetical protein